LPVGGAFFRVGQARGGLLMKFYARERQPEDELRDEPDKHGLEVGRLEREGRFLISHEADPPDGRSARKKPTREAEKVSPSLTGVHLGQHQAPQPAQIVSLGHAEGAPNPAQPPSCGSSPTTSTSSKLVKGRPPDAARMSSAIARSKAAPPSGGWPARG
jgi:hypothetical protein